MYGPGHVISSVFIECRVFCSFLPRMGSGDHRPHVNEWCWNIPLSLLLILGSWDYDSWEGGEEEGGKGIFQHQFAQKPASRIVPFELLLLLFQSGGGRERIVFSSFAT